MGNILMVRVGVMGMDNILMGMDFHKDFDIVMVMVEQMVEGMRVYMNHIIMKMY